MVSIEPGISNVELRGSMREAPALLFLPALLATHSGSSRSPLAGVCRAGGSLSSLNPKTGRNGEAGEQNVRYSSGLTRICVFTFTTCGLESVKRQSCCKSLTRLRLGIHRSIPASRPVKAVVKENRGSSKGGGRPRVQRSNLHPLPFFSQPARCKSPRLSRRAGAPLGNTKVLQKSRTFASGVLQNSALGSVRGNRSHGSQRVDDRNTPRCDLSVAVVRRARQVVQFVVSWRHP